MHRYFFLSIFFVLFFEHTGWSLHVIVDPGHGGKDKGATMGSIKESDLALKMAFEIRDLLQSRSHDKVTLTRETDVFKSLLERTQIANRSQGNLFISIHVNSSPEPKAQGAEFYFQNQITPDEDLFSIATFENGTDLSSLPNSEEADDPMTKKNDVKRILEDLTRFQRIVKSQFFSRSMREQWPPPKKHKSVRQAPFFVISNVKMPSALIELGYLTNPHEGEQLISPEHQKKIAQQIFLAIQKYKDTF